MNYKKFGFTLAEVKRVFPRPFGERVRVRGFKAFTLAEVLITLGIIGVVAAITLPTLLQNYKKKAWTTQLQKSYSHLEQAFQKMMADDEVQKLSDTSVWASKGNMNCNYINNSSYSVSNINCKEFVNNLNKYIKIINADYGDKIHYLGNNQTENTNYYFFILPDGTMISFDFFNSAFTQNTERCNQIKSLGGNMCSFFGRIYVDVNGKRGPNTFGKDVFYFIYSDEGKLYPYYGKDWALFNSLTPLDRNGNHWRKNSANCGEPDGGITSNTIGDGCAARTIESGWKMDY